MATRRDVIDTVVRSSTIELLGSYGIATAPLTGRVPETEQLELFGSIPFTAPAFRGTLLLLVPTAILSTLENGSTDPQALRSLLRELTNQLMGRIKNRFSRYQFVVQVGLPSLLDGRMLSQRLKGGELRYAFRTLKSDVHVILLGDFDSANLEFSVTTQPAEEGDIILF
jgi:hypothetical protein